jgi:hypothetical protein
VSPNWKRNAELDKPDEQQSLDEALESLQTAADSAAELADRLAEEPARPTDEGEQLIEDVAQRLAKTREAVGLPSKDVSQLKAEIKARQNSS